MTKGHFEAKKHAYRQTQDGVVVSFVIHPSDVPADLATAPLGTIYMIGFAAVGEPDGDVRASVKAEHKAPIGKADEPSSPSKPKQRWDQLSPSARAALLTKDPAFWEYLRVLNWSECADAGAADRVLKMVCGISSKTELDATTSGPAAKFNNLDRNFRAWQQAKGHQAA